MDSIDLGGAPLHGAVVIMTLTVGECQSLDVAQLAPEWLILRNPARITAAPGARAEIDLRVDGQRRTWLAVLPAGIALGQDRIPIAAP